MYFKFHYVLCLVSLADNLSYNFKLHHFVSRLSSIQAAGRPWSESGACVPALSPAAPKCDG